MPCACGCAERSCVRAPAQGAQRDIGQQRFTYPRTTTGLREHPPLTHRGASVLCEVGRALARRLVLRVLGDVRGGELEIVEGDERLRARAPRPRRPLRAVVEVRSPRFYRPLLRGSVGLCESYMDGLWDCEDLVALTRIAALNVRALDRCDACSRRC